MIINYNSLSRGRDAWLKKDVGDFVGSPPMTCTDSHWKTLLSVLMLLMSVVLGQQTWAQNSASYTFSTNITGSLAADRNANVVDMSTGTTLLVDAGLDAKASSVTNIGFDFDFMGSRYTQFSVQEDGILQLGATVVSTNAYTLTGGSATAPRLAAFNADMRTGTVTGKIHYKLIGSAPNRVLVVEFKEMQLFWTTTANATAGSSTFQTRLYESGAIEYVYGTMSATNVSTSASDRAPSVGFYTGSATGAFASISYATHTVSTTSPYAANATVAATGAITNLNSAADGSRRAYVFLPPPPCAAPVDQATALTFGSATFSSIPVSFTAAASAPTGYLVVRYPSGAATTNPVNVTTYTVGTALGLGTVVSVGTALSFTNSGLAPATTYDYYVYDYNATGCFPGPAYNTTAPLTGSAATVNGTLSGIKTVGAGGDYNNLTTAFAAINTNGLSGNVELQLIAGYPAAAETYPIVSSNALAVGNNTVKIYPTVAGLSISSANTTGTLSLNNAKNITIDGRVNQTGAANLVIANTNAGASYAILFSNDATNNTIQYATIQSVNTSTSSGTIVFGTAAGLVTGNDNNTIANCDIKDGATFPVNAIYSAGTSNAIDNSGNTISNNLISNYFGATGTNSNGINIASASSAWTITGNRFFQTGTRTPSSGQFTRAIQISTANGGGYAINNNIIGYANAAGTGTTTYAGAVANRFAGMDITVANTPVSNIQGNTVAGISLTTSSGAATTPGIFTGIAVSGSSNIGTTAANTIGAASGTGSISITSSTNGGAVWGIYSTTTGTTTIQNNVVAGINATGTTATVGVLFNGIQSAGSGGVSTVTGNTIGNTTVANSIVVGTSGLTTGTTSFIGVLNSSTGSPANLNSNTVANIANNSSSTSSTLNGIQNSSSSSGATINLNSNIVRNVSMVSGTLTGIYESSSSSATTIVNANNNQVYNLIAVGTGTTSIYGIRSTTSNYTHSTNQIYNLSITANAGTAISTVYGIYNLASPTGETISNNDIHDFSIAGSNTLTGTNTNTIAGIYTNTTTGSKTFSGNKIYGFTYTNSSTSPGAVMGISTGLSSPNIFKNKIYNLTATNGAGSYAYGIHVLSGNTVQLYNNLIGNLSAPASSLGAAPSVAGLYIVAGTTVNAYYNTINIGGSGGTNFGSAAVYANTAAGVNLRNNIFNNTATASGTGKTVGYQRSSTTIGTYAATSNNNLFYAGTPSASNVIYFDGTNADQTLADFKTRMATRDQASVTQNPSFTSTTGSSTDFLHIAPATPTFIESGAVAIAGFADDFDGDVRNATTSDIGADEFAGTPIGCIAATAGTIASPSTAANICVSGTVTITASGYSSGTGTTYQWESSADAGFTSPVAIGTPSSVYSNFSGTVNTNISYRLKVVCTNGPVTSYSNVVSFTVSNPTITSTTPAARCGVGTVTLAATGGSGETIHWYNASTGGSSLGTGSSFVTPIINASTTFYASPEVGTSSTATMGAGASTSGLAPYSPADGTYGGQKGQYLFTAAELVANGLVAGNINSLSFEATVAGSALQGFTVQMGNTPLTGFSSPVTIVGGLTTVLNSATLTPIVGVNTLTLSTPFSWDGISNIIVSTSWSNNNTSNTASTIKYDATTNYSSQSYRKDNETAANMLAFFGATGSGTNSFDRSQNRPKFTFTASGCSGTRTAVVATVNAPPALTLSAASASFCAGDGTLTPVTVTSTVADYDTYTWSPATGVTGNPTSGYIFNPASTTTYTLTASQSAGSLCQNTVAFTVNVNALPTITSLTANPASICIGQVSALTAVVPTATASGYVLTGSTGTYTPITGTTVSILDEDDEADDVGVGNLPIGFAFNYNGVSQTVFGVSSNGLLIVGNTSASFVGLSNNVLVSTANVIAPLWDDNNVTDGTIIYATTGTAGNRKLTVQWTNMNVGGSGSMFSPTISMQAILYETGGIEFRYGSTSSALSSISASIGISTASGNYKSVTPASPASASTASSTAEYSVTASTNIPSGTVYSFAPPLTSTVTWSPLDNLYTTAAATTAYTGGPATTVYAKLIEPAVYKATAKTAANCETSQEVSVSIGNPPVADIAGPDSICMEGSNTITLTNATPTGVWSSSNTAIATIDGTGVLTPLAEGVVTISYAVTSTGCTTTKTKEVAVNEPVVIVSSTPTQTIAAGTGTTFTVNATGTGTPALTYQWEITTDGENFTPLVDNATYSGTNTATLTISNAGIELNETLYHVVVTGICGSVPTEIAVLLVGDTGIDTQPTNQTACESPTSTVDFTVVASEDVTDYQWYEDRGGDNWLPITDGGIYAGATTTTLSLSGLAYANNGWKYKVLVTGLGSAESNPVTLTVIPTIVVTRPANQTVCYTGGTASFTAVTTLGTPSSFAWQYSADNGLTWNAVANATPVGVTYATANTATLGVTTTAATPSTGIYLYRAVVGSATCGSVFSESTQLIINRPVIVTPPAAASVAAGNNATFTVTATTIGTPTYQWQFATTLNGTYTNVVDATPAYVTYTGATSATLTVQTTGGTAPSSAFFYRVIVSSPVGCSVTSTGGQMTVSNYCRATYSNGPGSGDQIINVTLGTLNNNSGISTSPYYAYFGNVTVPDVQQLTTANVSVKFGSNSSSFAGVWIDLNHNNQFEASEGVVSTVSAGANGTAILSLPIPLTATLGQTRMRVRGGDDSAMTTSMACGASNSTWGESEDYIVNIVAAPVCSGAPVAGTVTTSAASICASGTVTLTASGYTQGTAGVSMQWYNSAGAISAATAATYTTSTLTANETYFLRVTCENGGAFSDSNSVLITVNNPAVVSTTPGSHCGSGIVTLGATTSPGNELLWYSAATAGNLLGFGNSFTTPLITANTNYYVAAGAVEPGSATVGAGGLTSGTAPYGLADGTYGGQKGQYLITAAELKAAGVRAGNITSMAFEATSVGSALQGFTVQMGTTALTEFTAPITIVGGLSTVANSATLTPVVGVNKVVFNTPFSWDGTSNIIVSTSWSNNNTSNSATTIRYNSTANYSSQSYRKDNESSANMLTFTGATGSGTSSLDRSMNRPKFIFEATNVISCIGTRTVVAATITPPPALTLSTSTTATCAGSATAPVTLNSPVGNFDSYVWSPAQGVSGTAATGFTFNPTASTTYTLTATNAAGCINTAALAVSVNPYPVVSITPPSAICLGEVATLTATQTGALANTYVFAGSAGTYADITGTDVPGAIGDDRATGNLPIGFTFNYNGTPQTVFAVSSNGFIELGSTDSYANNTAAGWLPSTNNLSGRANIIAPFWDDNNTTGGTVQYATTGTAGNRVLTVQWTNTHIGTNGSATSPTFNMQALLYEATGAVEFKYGAKSTAFTTVSASIGLSAAVGRYVSLTPLAPASASTISSTSENTTAAETNIPSGTIYRFTPNAVTWSPVTDLYLDAAATIPYAGTNATTVYSKATVTRVYAASVSNASNCSATANATVTVKQFYDFYVDSDGDHYGTGAAVQLCAASASEAPAGYAALNGDCNDNPATGALVNPGMAEIFYNGIDDNCDGNIDEGRQLTTALLANRCDTKLTKIYHSVNADWRTPGATGYRFRIRKKSNLQDEQTIDRSVAYFNFNYLNRFDYGTTYLVDVMIQRNNVWLNYYGPTCEVTTPDVAKLYVCGGTVAAKGTGVFSEVLLYVTAYRFELTNLTTNQVTPISNGHHYFTFNEVPGFTAGGQYSVKVSVKTNGDWSPYGAACIITAPGGSGPEIPTDKIEVSTSNVFKVAAYPNPYAEAFGLNIATESNAVVNVKVYDMLGKLIEIRNASVTDLKEQRIGERYSAGVYNIIVTQEENVKTLRVIKR